MIQLERAPKPNKLTEELKEKLTQKFLESGKAVWKRKFLIKALLKISHGKCCYCECLITEESKYLEVEHFYPKSLYPSEVLTWENLLPSCGRCNRKKGSHDTKVDPIIHPIDNNPKGHLIMRDYSIYKKTELGGRTLEVLKLNERLTLKRSKIGKMLEDNLENLLELITDIGSGSKDTTQFRRKAVYKFEKLLDEATPPKEYCATAAHVILHDPNFAEIKQKMIQLGLWNDFHQDLEKIARKYAFDKK